jgi:hypothetical protein
MTATVKYELAHLKGELEVPFVDPEDDNEVIIDKAKSELRKKHGYLPSGAEYFRVVKRSK